MVFARSGRRTPMHSVVVARVVETSGIWTRSSSRSVAKDLPFGGRWIRMATCSICGSQSRRNKQAAKRFFRKLLKELQYVPRVIVTEKLKSYGAAKREILPGVEHRQHQGLNNRAENAHQPTRLREKKRRRFTSAKQAQRFLSAFGPISEHFQPRRHRLRAKEYRAIFQTRFQTWNEVTETQTAAERCMSHSSSSASFSFPVLLFCKLFHSLNKLTISIHTITPSSAG